MVTRKESFIISREVMGNGGGARLCRFLFLKRGTEVFSLLQVILQLY